MCKARMKSPSKSKARERRAGTPCPNCQLLGSSCSLERKAKPSYDNAALSIDLELVSTDGSNFKWKPLGQTEPKILLAGHSLLAISAVRWGSNHAHYRFGDLLIRG